MTICKNHAQEHYQQQNPLLLHYNCDARPHNHRRAKSCRLVYILASCNTPPSIHKYVHIGKLRIRPTDVAASNIPSCNGSCFSVYIFTALGPLFPPPLDCPNGIHSHLSPQKATPFRKCCGGCTVG